MNQNEREGKQRCCNDPFKGKLRILEEVSLIWNFIELFFSAAVSCRLASDCGIVYFSTLGMTNCGLLYYDHSIFQCKKKKTQQVPQMFTDCLVSTARLQNGITKHWHASWDPSTLCCRKHGKETVNKLVVKLEGTVHRFSRICYFVTQVKARYSKCLKGQ